MAGYLVAPPASSADVRLSAFAEVTDDGHAQ